MPRNYDVELEMALREAFREDFEGELEAPAPKGNRPQAAQGCGSAGSRVVHAIPKSLQRAPHIEGAEREAQSD